MIKVNQQLTQINKTKEIVLRDSLKHNVFHENLHSIIAECIYENRNKKQKYASKKQHKK